MTRPFIRLATILRDHRSVLANIRNFLFAPRGREDPVLTLNHRVGYLSLFATANGP